MYPKSPHRVLAAPAAVGALVFVLLFGTAIPLRAVAAGKGSASLPTWDRQAAERYLDDREVWWQGWDRTQKDHGTYCISCHTQAPYGLARPVLRKVLGEPDPTGAELAMLASIKKRVRLWKEVEPFYLDTKYGPGKEVESRDAESVLNALILASYDERTGHLSETTRMAFANAWALQSRSGSVAGAWVWQNFHYTPWESPESEYHGAALMAEALGRAPDGYSRDPAIAPNVAALRHYLRSHYDGQPLLNKIVALWASADLPGLLTSRQREQLMDEIDRLQRNDGGWSLADLGNWKRVDNTALVTRSDGYATGLIVLTLEETRTRKAATAIERGRAWLVSNQDKSTGAWPAWSLNKDRDPRSNAGPFMSDAATAYAVLALEAQ
jgi:squalene-hopene/tetraprenyl-beta-curcumene cyclase